MEKVTIVRKPDGSWHVESKRLDVTVETRPDGGANVDISIREDHALTLETPKA